MSGRSPIVGTMGSTDVEVRRSSRRRRTVSAYRQDGRTIVLIPARFTRAEERHWVATMVARLEKSDERRRPSDDDLQVRAAELSRRYLDGLARPTSIRWVTNQRSRWGSCTPTDGTIRISARLKGMPAYVVDYVVLHELAHLLAPGHGSQFWALLQGYPRLERARGYLEGVASASGLNLSDVEDVDDEPLEPGQAALDFDPGE
jgi:predicted metal-dependent hydrolase